jgi:hypothetical protein
MGPEKVTDVPARFVGFLAEITGFCLKFWNAVSVVKQVVIRLANGYGFLFDVAGC